MFKLLKFNITGHSFWSNKHSCNRKLREWSGVEQRWIFTKPRKGEGNIKHFWPILRWIIVLVYTKPANSQRQKEEFYLVKTLLQRQPRPQGPPSSGASHALGTRLLERWNRARVHFVFANQCIHRSGVEYRFSPTLRWIIFLVYTKPVNSQ